MAENENAFKKLKLDLEALHELTPDERRQVFRKVALQRPWYCWTIVVPSSGITTLIPITMGDC